MKNIPVLIKTAFLAAFPSVRDTEAYHPLNLLDSGAELIEINVPTGEGDTVHIIKRDVRVIDIWTVKQGATGVGSAKTATVKNGSTALSSAISLASAVGTLARTTSLDPAQANFKAGGKLTVTVVRTAEDSSCTVYVLARRI